MKTEIHFCKASQWSVRRIEEELIIQGIEYQMQYDDELHCGSVVVEEEKGDEAEVAAEIVFAYSQLTDVE